MPPVHDDRWLHPLGEQLIHRARESQGAQGGRSPEGNGEGPLALRGEPKHGLRDGGRALVARDDIFHGRPEQLTEERVGPRRSRPPANSL